VPVGAGDDQIRPFVLCEPDQLSGTRSLLMYDYARTAANAVARQITGDVVDVFLRGRLLAGLTDFDDGDADRLAQEAERILDGTARFARILPADHDVLRAQRGDRVGHDRRDRLVEASP
jgi:hypothetical protein